MGNERILVMWSGGVDSTAALYHVLNNSPRAAITAHQVILRDARVVERVQRSELEEHAVQQMLPWLMNNVRSFKYTKSVHTYHNKMRDIPLINFNAAMIAALENYPVIVRGRTAKDFDYGYGDPGSLSERRIVEMVKAAWLQCPGEQEPVFYFPLEHMSKRAAYDLLPEFLKPLTWSCRDPLITPKNVAVACGHCSACVEMIDAEIPYHRTINLDKQ